MRLLLFLFLFHYSRSQDGQQAGQTVNTIQQLPASPGYGVDLLRVMEQHRRWSEALLGNHPLAPQNFRQQPINGFRQPDLIAPFQHPFNGDLLHPHLQHGAGAVNIFDHPLMHPAAFTHSDGSSTDGPATTTVSPQQPPEDPILARDATVIHEPAVQLVPPTAQAAAVKILELEPMSIPRDMQHTASQRIVPASELVQQLNRELNESSTEKTASKAQHLIVSDSNTSDSEVPPKKDDSKMWARKKQHKHHHQHKETPVKQETKVDAEVKQSDEEEFIHFFRALNLSETDRKAIVQHVEHILVEEISKKLKSSTSAPSASPEPSTEPSTSPSPSTTAVPATTPFPAPSPTFPPVPAPSPALATNHAHSRTVPTTTHRPLATLRIREQKDIRESQPRIPRINDGDSEWIHRGQDKQFGFHHPLKTTDTHLSFASRALSAEEKSQTEQRSRDVLDIADSNVPEDNAPLVTGAPLDLAEEAESVAPALTKVVVTMTSPPPQPTTVYATTTFPPPVYVNPRRGHYQGHGKTDFERLAADYRQRLSGTDDVNKLLQNFYNNAYIAIVQHKEEKPRRRGNRNRH